MFKHVIKHVQVSAILKFYSFLFEFVPVSLLFQLSLQLRVFYEIDLCTLNAEKLDLKKLYLVEIS